MVHTNTCEGRQTERLKIVWYTLIKVDGVAIYIVSSFSFYASISVEDRISPKANSKSRSYQILSLRVEYSNAHQSFKLGAHAHAHPRSWFFMVMGGTENWWVGVGGRDVAIYYCAPEG